ncbi:hypothetical protein CKO19_07735 [Rhodovulum adriaticum]|nr:hypothetical protein [Rhodovulum adriaticum]
MSHSDEAANNRFVAFGPIAENRQNPANVTLPTHDFPAGEGFLQQVFALTAALWPHPALL